MLIYHEVSKLSGLDAAAADGALQLHPHTGGAIGNQPCLSYRRNLLPDDSVGHGTRMGVLARCRAMTGLVLESKQSSLRAASVFVRYRASMVPIMKHTVQPWCYHGQRGAP